MQYECIVGVATSNGKYYWPGNVIDKSEYDMLLPNEKKKFLLKASSYFPSFSSTPDTSSSDSSSSSIFDFDSSSSSSDSGSSFDGFGGGDFGGSGSSGDW